MKIGTAVSARWLHEDPVYAGILGTQFHMLTPENELKFESVQPGEGRFDFLAAEELVRFADAHSMSVRGHALVWHNQLPDWLLQQKREACMWRRQLEHHIQTVVQRFEGKLDSWDVVNEAVADDGSLRASPWFESIGPEAIGIAFRLAHQADPRAKLFYNDYGAEGLGRKSDAVFRLLRSLLEDGVPVHGVGLQLHVSEVQSPLPDEIFSNLERLGSLGLEVQITEMDVRMRVPCAPDALLRQAKLFRDLLEPCLASDHCTSVTLWGFSDRYSWIPGHFPGWGEALLFDHQDQPKPSFHALMEVFQSFARSGT